MTDLQGAVGLVQLPKLNRLIEERAKWGAYYRQHLSGLEWLSLPEEPADGRHGWQAFVTYVDPEKAPMSRNDLMEYLQEKGISTRPGTHAVHMLNYYIERFSIKPDDYPGARDCNDHSMAIPLHNRMDEEDYDYVVQALRTA
jgi:dTDP-4-amino-4,6-dideoxygalactose transaminase